MKCMKISHELVTKSLNHVQGIQILALKCLYFRIFCYPDQQGTKYSRDQPGTFFSGVKKPSLCQ